MSAAASAGGIWRRRSALMWRQLSVSTRLAAAAALGAQASAANGNDYNSEMAGVT